MDFSVGHLKIQCSSSSNVMTSRQLDPALLPRAAGGKHGGHVPSERCSIDNFMSNFLAVYRPKQPQEAQFRF